MKVMVQKVAPFYGAKSHHKPSQSLYQCNP